jgi:adenylate cyclase
MRTPPSCPTGASAAAHRVYLGPMDPGELEALGVYDPVDPNAGLRLELLEYLIELGATPEELVAYRDTLPRLAGTLGIRGGPALTLAEAAERAGIDGQELRRLLRAAGLPEPDPDARILTEDFAVLGSTAGAAADFFGQDALEQLVRVMGSAMARVADAVLSAFLVNVEPTARREDPVGLAVARANVEATAFLPLVPAALDALFRQHLLAAQRTTLADAGLIGYESQDLVVGFVDLVGSAELAERLDLGDLGAALRMFETIAMDTVTAGGGRLIKLIGDEVLYTAIDSRSGSRIAVDIAAACHDNESLPEVRAGLAAGTVMLRDGDVFGPVVNLASRIVHLANPGEIVATPEVADGSGLRHVPRGRFEVRGIAGDLELVTILA